MDLYTSHPLPAGTAPQTWREGGSTFSVVKLISGNYGWSTADSGSPPSGRTVEDSWSGVQTRKAVYTYGATRFEVVSTTYRSGTGRGVTLYEPSTGRGFVPGVTNEQETVPGSLGTIIYNVTMTNSSVENDSYTTANTFQDTFSSVRYSRATSFESSGVVEPPSSDWEGNPVPDVTQYGGPRTVAGATKFVASREETLGSSTVTTALTGDDGFYQSQWSTRTYSIPTVTNPTQTQTSTSSWLMEISGLTLPSTQGTSANEVAITYAEEFLTNNTREVVIGTDSYTAPVTSEAVTQHHFGKMIDTVVLMHAGRNQGDYKLGDMLWSFSLTALPATGSTTGRFTDLFASESAARVTIPDYQKYSTHSVAVTAITSSNNTTQVSTSTRTAPEIESDPSAGTAKTTTIISTTWMNGVTWNEYETYFSGSETRRRPAISNISTATHTVSIGEVGSSVHTFNHGDPVSIGSLTHWTHTVQETVYDSVNSSWTSATVTAEFGSASSYSEPYLALFSPHRITIDILSRKTRLDDLLVPSWSKGMSGTDSFLSFLGSVRTSSTHVFGVASTATVNEYAAEFHVYVAIYETSSTQTFENGGEVTSFTRSDGQALTHRTERRLTPEIWAAPFILTEGLNVAWFKALPYGYAGFGGDFTAANLDVHTSVAAGLLTGEVFAGQSVATGALPTVSFYEGVTGFPVRTDFSFTLPGAARASYISRMDGVGTASMAVTWTSTTVSEGSTLTVSRLATHTLAGEGVIEGDFWRQEPINFNSSGQFHLLGGYAIGDNNLANSYEVRIGSGFCQWTEYATSQSSATVTKSASGSNGSVSFTVAASNAIVLSVEPIFTAQWGGGGDVPFFFSSTPHVPFS